MGAKKRGQAPRKVCPNISEEFPTFTSYCATDDEYCKKLAPAWNAAMRQWATEELGSKELPVRGKVTWQWKECYGPLYRDGKDAEECDCVGIKRVPTLIFRGGSSPNGGEIFID